MATSPEESKKVSSPSPAGPSSASKPKPSKPTDDLAADFLLDDSPSARLVMPKAAAKAGPAPAAKPAVKPSAPAAATKPVSGSSPAPAKPTAKSPSRVNEATPPVGVPAAVASKPAPAAKKPAPPKNRFAHIDANTRQLGQKLVDLGVLDDAQLESLYEEMRTLDIRLGDLAVERGLVTAEQLLQATAELHGMRLVNLEEMKPQPEAVKLVAETMAKLYKMVPLTYENDTLTVALADPNNLMALDDIRNLLGIQTVTPVLAPLAQVEAMIDKAYSGAVEETISGLISSLETDPALNKKKKKSLTGARETSIDLDSEQELANSAPVRKLINMVLLMSIRDHASDIHFEPFEDEYKMRYKCDGVLYEMVPPPRHLANAIASRIKVMANLDIAERRIPQDGRIELNVGGNRIDMRVSVLPTLFGESIVIRILDKSSVGLSLERVGMPSHVLAQFRQVCKKPNGIVLVTGPTGSGKTTTLYSALSELNDLETKIITTEDPVEYEIDGIVQCPINHEIDLTFASALRAILRQDPDIILVGEIRDLETAQIAIQASLTGHLVFSTLHTNDAPSSITRLRDMGVEPYLITATVEAIQAQRLVRTICPACRTPYTPTRDQLMELNLTPEQTGGKPFYYGEGCTKCNNTGYKGRTGLFELMVMNDDLRDMVSRGASTDQITAQVRKMGVPSLREAGIQALYNGITTIDEVVRETVLEDL